MLASPPSVSISIFALTTKNFGGFFFLLSFFSHRFLFGRSRLSTVRTVGFVTVQTELTFQQNFMIAFHIYVCVCVLGYICAELSETFISFTNALKYFRILDLYGFICCSI